MEDILYDYHVGQAVAQLEDETTEQRNLDRTVYMEAVLKKHGVSRADFDSSMVFYYTHAERLEKMYRRVAERLSEEALDLGASEGEVERYASFTIGGDTANVWEGNKTAMLMPYAPFNRMDFRQVADTTWHKGDDVLLNMMVDFMYQSGMKNAVVCVNVRLDNDSVISRASYISVSGVSQLRLMTDDERTVKEVYGYVYLGKGNDQSSTLKLMFLKDIQLIRIHKQKPVEPARDSRKDSVAVKRDSAVVGRDSLLHSKDTLRRLKDTVTVKH
jgi:hypothetical protein